MVLIAASTQLLELALLLLNENIDVICVLIVGQQVTRDVLLKFRLTLLVVCLVQEVSMALARQD